MVEDIMAILFRESWVRWLESFLMAFEGVFICWHGGRISWGAYDLYVAGWSDGGKGY